MTGPDDYSDEMAGHYLDDDAEDGILDPTSSPAEAPPGFELVASLVSAASAPARPDELSLEDDVVARMVAVVREAPAVSDPTRGRPRVFRKTSLAKVVPITASLVLAGSAAAAAAGPFKSHAPALAPRAAAPHVAGAAWTGARLRPVAGPALLAATLRHHTTGRRVALDRSGAAAASGGHFGGGSESQVEGTVLSVNGATGAGSCGTAGAAGSFVLVRNGVHGQGNGREDHTSTVTVDVTATTTFADIASTDPSFADVCSGGHVHASGNFATSGSTTTTASTAPTFDATKVDVQVPMAQVGG